MDTIVGNYILNHYEIEIRKSIEYRFNTSEYSLYEVIRVIDGVLLFLDDHLDRLDAGIRLLGMRIAYDRLILRSALQRLIIASEQFTGNIKLLFKSSHQKTLFAAYFIPHSYPGKKLYDLGVILGLLLADRPDPQLKQLAVSERIRFKLDEIKKTSEAYEVLLVNHKGFITEGSKSNFFLIKGNSLFSAPENEILSGITRKYVLSIARQEGIEMINTHIKPDDLGVYEAAFICGTSPKILPVSKIDKFQFMSDHSIIRLIKNRYNSIIQDYIKNWKF